MKKPELLAPAGDYEKLQAAVYYGADAVYMGGQKYGLRAKTKNFDQEGLGRGVCFAHSHGVKAYITANIFAHNADIAGIGAYFAEIEKLGADGVIISDPGFFAIAREVAPSLEIHVSTQANITNYRSVLFWRALGAKRAVLARELTFEEIREISDMRGQVDPGFQLEAFVHGAMCVSYSGRCLLSSYMTGRDANKGECAHPCRYSYALSEMTRPGQYMPIEEDSRGTYILNAQDLCMIEHIGELIDAGIDSFKIEGRTKTAYYVATVVKAYRDAIDDYCADPARYAKRKPLYLEELRKASHREFGTGFYMNGMQRVAPKIMGEDDTYKRDYDFVGLVLGYDAATGFAIIEQRNKFSVGDEVEFLTAKGEGFSQMVREMANDQGERITEAPHPQQRVRLKVEGALCAFDMMRRACTPPGR